MRALLAAALSVFTTFALSARPLDEAFPNLEGRIKSEALAARDVYFYHTADRNARGRFSGLEIRTPQFLSREISGILDQKPRAIVEMLAVIPLHGKTGLLDIYNAVGKTVALAGRTYFSQTRGRQTPLFKSVHRIKDEKSTQTQADPPPAKMIPAREDIFFVVDDVNFGFCRYTSQFTLISPGIAWHLYNTTNISLYFFTVIKKEKLHIFFYLEPVDEGMLVYGIAGLDTEDFVASHADLPSAMKKRLDVVKDWITDGIQ